MSALSRSTEASHGHLPFLPRTLAAKKKKKSEVCLSVQQVNPCLFRRDRSSEMMYVVWLLELSLSFWKR